MIKRLFLFLIYLLCCASVFAQTSEPGAAKKEYHNITSRYNGYFNGNEILKEILFKLSLKQQDDYTKILDVFTIGTEADRRGVAGDADNVIKKASFVIQRHEIGRWVDDCYIMIGKAYYYKADFFTAIESFQYVAGKYTGDPTEVEALIWLTKCHTSLQNFEKATNTITTAKTKSGGKFRSLQFEFHKAYADLLIKTKNYRKASEELLNALAYAMPRLERARLNFILAQVYEKLNRADRSIIFYKRAIRKTPPYEMVFNSKIAIARLKDEIDTATTEKKGVEVMLDKMLNDEKNKEYQDQIFYTLAGIEFNKKNYTEAKRFYQKSVQVSINNPIQKGLSYLAIAELDYNQFSNFVEAGSYYDSTLATLPKTYSSYEDILFKRRNLDDLSRNILTIKKQDSLLALGNLNESEYQKYLDDQLRTILKENELKKRDKKSRNEANIELADPNNPFNNTTNNTETANASDKWYFYSPTSLSSGISEFRKRWGDRSLEDDWRRAVKQTFNEVLDDPDNTSPNENEESENPNTILERIAKDIPRSKEAKAITNDKIIEAYWELGNIYKDQLQDYTKAIEMFDSLNSRYPRNKYTLESLYQLYRVYENKNDKNLAVVYEQKILNEYPNSIYAEIIRNPEYGKKANIKQVKMNEIYEESLNAYYQKNFWMISENKTRFFELNPDKEMSARYALLEAYVKGSTNDKDTYIEALQLVNRQYPGTEAAKKATENIKLLNEKE